MTLPLGIRLEANALIDRLVADDIDTFDPAEASQLLELVPCDRRRRWFAFSLRGQLPGGTTKGHAAGVGTAEMENEFRVAPEGAVQAPPASPEFHEASEALFRALVLGISRAR